MNLSVNLDMPVFEEVAVAWLNPFLLAAADELLAAAEAVLDANKNSDDEKMKELAKAVAKAKGRR